MKRVRVVCWAMLVSKRGCASRYPVAQDCANPRTASSRPARIDQADTKHGLDPGEDPDNHLVVAVPEAHRHRIRKNSGPIPHISKSKISNGLPHLRDSPPALIASDSWISKQIPDKPSQLNRSLNISDYSALFHDWDRWRLLSAGGDDAQRSPQRDWIAKRRGRDQRHRHHLYLERNHPARKANVGNGKGDFFTGGQSFPRSTRASRGPSPASGRMSIRER